MRTKLLKKIRNRFEFGWYGRGFSYEHWEILDYHDVHGDIMTKSTSYAAWYMAMKSSHWFAFVETFFKKRYKKFF